MREGKIVRTGSMHVNVFALGLAREGITVHHAA